MKLNTFYISVATKNATHRDSKINSSLDLKGQSAVEYLITYGWMLLVVAVVGGAVFSMAQSDTPDTISGFIGGNVLVDDFGVTTDNELSLQVRSGSGQGIIVSEINVSDPDTGDYVWKNFTSENRVFVGRDKIFQLPNVTRSDSGNTLDVDIIYHSGELESLIDSGTITGGLELQGVREVEGSPEEHKEPGTQSLAVEAESEWNQGVYEDADFVSESLKLAVTDTQPNQVWNFSDHSDTPEDIDVDEEGNVYVGEYNFYGASLLKIDETGEEVWSYDGHSGSYGAEVVTIPGDGHFYTASRDDTVHKVNISCKDQGGSDTDCREWSYDAGSGAMDVYVDQNEYVYVSTSSNEIHKLNQTSSGPEMLWNYTDHESTANAVIANDGGEVFIGTSSEESLVKIDGSGNFVWEYNDFDRAVNDLSLDKEGNIYAVADHGHGYGQLHKVNDTGGREWLSNDITNTPHGVEWTEHGIYVANYAGLSAGEVSKFDSNGDLEWVYDDLEDTGDAVSVVNEDKIYSITSEATHRVEELNEYSSSGSYTSETFDEGEEWIEITTNSTVPGDTDLDGEVLLSDTDSDWENPDEVVEFNIEGGEESSTINEEFSYLRFRLDLSTSDQTETPEIEAVEIEYSE